MRSIKHIIISLGLFLLLVPNWLSAQPGTEFSALRTQILTTFSQFEYQQTLQLIDQAGKLPNLARNERLFLMEYQSYTLLNIGQVDSAQAVFSRLLALDPNYRLDTQVASPKILQIFEEIRAELHQHAQPGPVTSMDANAELRNAYVKTLILPGWGHLARGQKVRGNLWLTGFLISGGTGLYLHSKTRSARSDYLAARQPDQIQKAYDRYNKFYRYRTGAWIATGAVWFLAQFDLIVFPPQTERLIQLRPQIDEDKFRLCLGIQF